MIALIMQLQMLSWMLARFTIILGDVNVNETLFKIVGAFAGPSVQRRVLTRRNAESRSDIMTTE